MRILFPALLLFTATNAAPVSPPMTSVWATNTSPKALFAVREAKRFLHLLGFPASSDCPSPGHNIVLGDTATAWELLPAAEAGGLPPLTTDEDHVVHTTTSCTVSTGPCTLILGGSPQAIVYGVYAFMEALGVRFSLHGATVGTAVVASLAASPSLPTVRLHATPAFTTRGIFPWHNFPEGPDWWRRSNYIQYAGALSTMRMNFLAQQNYPISPSNRNFPTSPLIWMGTRDAFDPRSGNVTKAYPVWDAASSMEVSSGCGGCPNYNATTLPSLSSGNVVLFPGACASSEIQEDLGLCFAGAQSGPTNQTAAQAVALVNAAGAFHRDTLSFARSVGVATCAGVEISETGKVVWPEWAAGESPSSLYRAMFDRIRATYPLDTFWFVTPISLRGAVSTSQQVANVIGEITTAHAVLRNMSSPLKLAVTGWAFGPKDDPDFFNAALPADVTLSTLTYDMGTQYPPDGVLANATLHPRFVIPWLESDGAILEPEVWLGRTLYHAQEAAREGVSGLLAIHWRVHPLGPQLAALAAAGWNTTRLPGATHAAVPSELLAAPKAYTAHNESFCAASYTPAFTGHSAGECQAFCDAHPDCLCYDASSSTGLCRATAGNDAAVDASGENYTAWTVASPAQAALWRDYVLHSFGTDSPPLVAAFASIDGDPYGGCPYCNEDSFPLVPKNLLAANLTAADIAAKYKVVVELKALRGGVVGDGNLRRLDWWIDWLSWSQHQAEVQGFGFQLDAALATIRKAPAGQRQQLAQAAVSLLANTSAAFQAAMDCLQRCVESPGELGTLFHVEAGVRVRFISDPASALQGFGASIPLSALPSQHLLPSQVPRLFLPASPSHLPAGPARTPLRANILASPDLLPGSATLWTRPLGTTALFSSAPMRQLGSGRGVYASDGIHCAADFEYRVSATLADGQLLQVPASNTTADALTVVCV